MKLVERKITAVITKEEKKAFETVHRVLSGICNAMRDCDNCPLADFCGTSLEPKDDIKGILNLCEVEGE